MKKASLLFALLCISRLTILAQAYEDKVKYDKKDQEAIAIAFEFPPQAVENAVVEKFKRMGFKAKEEKGIFNSDKGFIQFKNANVPLISRDRMDYIVNVERKSRKEKDESILYLIMYRKDNNAIPQMDEGEIRNAKAFLENLYPDVEAADLELQIKAQDEALTKLAKKMGDLRNEKETLEKKLVDNWNQQMSTLKDSVVHRQMLDSLMSRRRY